MKCHTVNPCGAPDCERCRPENFGDGEYREARVREPWMELSQSEVDRLDEEDWQDYLDRRCLCAAKGECECICGAWKEGNG